MITVENAIDLHVHAGPELFVRRGDAIDFARRARQAGMAAILLKAHHESTASRAQLAERVVRGVRVFGSITLNRFVGGFNPFAVGAALEMGAKAVFMPTMHSQEHIKEFGPGTYGLSDMTVSDDLSGAGQEEGLTVLDKNGELTSNVKTIVSLIHKHNAFLASSHLSTREIEILVEECRVIGTRIVITHAFHVPRGDADFYGRMARKGAFVEIAANTSYPIAWHQGHAMSLQQAADLIEMVGPEKAVISTDAGQPFAPWPADILEAFVNSLSSVGVSEEALRHMMTISPRELLAVSEEYFDLRFETAETIDDLGRTQ